MNNDKPKFIAVEGCEGSGKSSLLAALKEEFKEKIITTREPGGSPYAEVIRDMALKHGLSGQAEPATLLCLMFASRFDHVKNTVKPALEAGKSVVTDRFDASSFAYQIAAGNARNRLESAFWNLRKALPILPDLYVFVDVDPAEGLRRRALAGGNNHLDDQPLEFHRKVREGFLEFLDQVYRHVVIDANRPLEEVKKDFLKLVSQEI